MENITEISVNKQEQWNAVVRSFSNYEVFYLNEYVTAFMRENKKNGIPVLLYYRNGNDKAINVIFKRDLSRDKKWEGKIDTGKYFDLISPYGYGGFLGTITDFETLNKIYDNYCKKHGYICEFVRFRLFESYNQYYDGKVETKMHNVIRSLDIPLEKMWMEFKPKVRKNVKHANKNGLKILIENTNEHLKEFIDIYYSTMDRSSAENEYYFSREFFEDLLKMPDNIMYFYVLFENNIISAELVIFGGENCYSYLGGTLKEYFDLRPNDFLKYEIIKWAQSRGLKNFVLGGGYREDDGIFQYKSCLAPNGIVDFYVGKKIFDEYTYQQLVNLRAKENPRCKESEYFPKYRD